MSFPAAIKRAENRCGAKTTGTVDCDNPSCAKRVMCYSFAVTSGTVEATTKRLIRFVTCYKSTMADEKCHNTSPHTSNGNSTRTSWLLAIQGNDDCWATTFREHTTEMQTVTRLLPACSNGRNDGIARRREWIEITPIQQPSRCVHRDKTDGERGNSLCSL